MVQHYLPNLIYGANDGIVTTLAVMSGVTGAALSNQIVLILGFASLFADGFSMGSSEYLSSRSEPEAEDRPPPKEAAKHGGATFAGFITAGIVPLLAYVLPWFEGQPFLAAVSIAMVTLFGIGASRAFFTDRGWLRAGLEMLLIGALAAGVAYGIGALGSSLTGGRQP
jgi:VIT1/CCC1 family predicted Fe2+/Mn2+ transporter